MTKTTYESLRDEYADLWSEMQIRDSKAKALEAGVKLIQRGKSAYQAVERETGVPWFVVGLIHKMESNCNMKRHLHNGDSLKKRTWRVPAGRPRRGSPPFDWYESAIDALKMKGYHKISEWPVERVCWALERYNGWGYRKYHGTVLSPYLWSYSTHYRRGKYVADGKWSSSAVSGQAGAMPLLALLAKKEDLALKLAVDPLPHDDDSLWWEEDPVEEFIKADDQPIKKAAKGSWTISGALTALGGVVAMFFDKTIQFAADALSASSSMAPVSTLMGSFGANAKTLGLAIAVGGVAIVIARRLQAAKDGKIG